MGLCRVCEVESFVSDEIGPVHPCCVLWARLEPGKPCQGCAESRANARRQRGRRRVA